MRSVPVICLVFGGGVGTIATMIEAKESGNPVVVMEGTGRVADVLSRWKDFQAQMAEVDTNGQRAFP